MQRSLVCLIVLALVGTACKLGGIDPKFLLPTERKAKITESAEAYGLNLRFSRIDEAALRVHPEERNAFIEAMSDKLAPRFTAFELESVVQGEDKQQANVKVRFELYNPPSLGERSIVEYQVWNYDVTSRRWYVRPDLNLYQGGVGSGKSR